VSAPEEVSDAGQERECLRRSLDHSKDRQATLRIRPRRADCPELANLPWELLYEESDDWFIALSVDTVVRYIQLPDPPRTVCVSLPLQVLVIRSQPADYPPLDLDDEWAQVAASMRELTDCGKVAFTELSVPTLSELRRELLRDEYHVMHYMGHGGFDLTKHLQWWGLLKGVRSSLVLAAPNPGPPSSRR
jgi:hypothetical protein